MNPLLSVCLITYNHKDYIVQAIEGVLMQKVNFSFELIIADDFSTDGTREIILDYEKKFPSLISLILQPNNVGPLKNWLDLINKPNTKFIAYFEGDDYWTDPYKLQKQVDFLENNKEFVLCYHDVNILYPDGSLKVDFIEKTKKAESSIYDLAIWGNYIHTCSIVFRNFVLTISEKNKLYLCDYLLYMHLTKYGKIKKMPEKMAVYRYGNGIWSSSINKKKQKFIIDNIYNILDSTDDDTIKEIMNLRLNSIAFYSLPNFITKIEDSTNRSFDFEINEKITISILLKIIKKKIILKLKKLNLNFILNLKYYYYFY
jgi:glycosyltransferase involved in cell wall biosynthesis